MHSLKRWREILDLRDIIRHIHLDKCSTPSCGPAVTRKPEDIQGDGNSNARRAACVRHQSSFGSVLISIGILPAWHGLLGAMNCTHTELRYLHPNRIGGGTTIIFLGNTAYN